MSNQAVRSVYLTAPDLEEARRLGRALLEERLVACVNLLPGTLSLYRWQGELREEPEVVMIAKTRAELVPRLSARVAELHSYEVPCVVAFAVPEGLEPYLDWVAAETSQVSDFEDG